MVRKLILALVCLLAPLSVRAQVGVTGNLKDAGVSNITGANTFVRMTLTGYGNNIPKVNGSNIIGRPYTDFHPDANGNISGTIQGNDSITPSGSAYQVCIFDNGTQFKCNNYSITGTSFNLNTATPVIVGPTNSSGFISAPRIFPFRQGSPSTTWTINHNFGDQDVIFTCYDTNNQYMLPGPTTESGINTLTVTFATAQAGSCVVMTAQNVSVTNQPANAVVTNPISTQVVNGATTTFQSPVNMTGANSLAAYNLNNLVFVDGVKYSTLNAAAADAACASSTGCTIDMRGNSNSAALNLGSFDPGTKAVSVLLGPYTYGVGQITVRDSFHLYGSSSSPGPGGQASTIIEATSPTNPIFVLGGTTPILGVDIEHFRLYCAASNSSQIAMNFVAPTGGGLWYSQFADILIGGDGVHECAGGSLVLNADAGGSPEAINQFLHFSDIYAFRPPNGAPALKLFGLNAQIQFDHTEWDGPEPHDSNKVNVLIDSGTQTLLAANTINFYNMTSQHAWGSTGVAVQINGCDNCVIDTGHFEDDNGGVQLQMGTHFGNWGTVVRNSLFTTQTARNSGNGFVTKTDVNSELDFENNVVYDTPDAMHAGDITYLQHHGTFNGFGGSAYPSPYSSFRAIVGYDPDGPAFKHKRLALGTITGGGTRTAVTFTWTTPFADANYTIGCTAIDNINVATTQGMVFERSNVQTNVGFTATILNGGTSVSNGFLDCWGWHD